jgi:hypothetical protein
MPIPRARGSSGAPNSLNVASARLIPPSVAVPPSGTMTVVSTPKDENDGNCTVWPWQTDPNATNQGTLHRTSNLKFDSHSGVQAGASLPLPPAPHILTSCRPAGVLFLFSPGRLQSPELVHFSAAMCRFQSVALTKNRCGPLRTDFAIVRLGQGDWNGAAVGQILRAACVQISSQSLNRTSMGETQAKSASTAVDKFPENF